ncbi:Putative vesicle-associated membrane protein family protein [Zea mays]|uniref:Putative vesicle-associated membrane protein family protein n=1 Tax=Zea mays TaxID=4577 RepID=A0A1D6PKL6_MAIZE|nr:Putative vesicle-associated membrane protein family protein [Zea mays]
MRYCDQHPEEIDKLAKVKAQVTEVKGVMMQNIEKVLDRGEKIELLVDKTEDLRSQVPHIYDLMHVQSIGSIDLTITKLTALVSPVGTRFQATGNKDTTEDVVGKHEDEAHRFRHRGCADPPHCLDNKKQTHRKEKKNVEKGRKKKHRRCIIGITPHGQNPSRLCDVDIDHIIVLSHV